MKSSAMFALGFVSGCLIPLVLLVISFTINCSR